MHEYLVIDADGSEQAVHRSLPSPEIEYYAELIYFYDGSVHAADVVFDQPVGDSFDLLVDPTNPASYEFPEPGYLSSATLLALAALFAAAAVH